MKKYINPPSCCNVCKRPFGKVMYDFRTRLGSWANGCDRCFKNYGIKLGVGFGQKYIRQGEDFIKHEG